MITYVCIKDPVYVYIYICIKDPVVYVAYDFENKKGYTLRQSNIITPTINTDIPDG